MGNQTDLHAKVLVVDRSIALVGSANLSFHGMVSNHEMALVVRGPTAEVIAERFDMLARSAAVRSFT
jgi:cardiolipin synthase